MGPRHFPVQTPQQLPPPHVLRRGDRVLLWSKTRAVPDLPSNKLAATTVNGDVTQAEPGASGIPEARTSDPLKELGSTDELPPACTAGNRSASRLIGEWDAVTGWNNLRKFTWGEAKLNGKAEMDVQALLQVSAAYRDAGETRESLKSVDYLTYKDSLDSHVGTMQRMRRSIDLSAVPLGVLFDCRITPAPSALACPLRGELPTPREMRVSPAKSHDGSSSLAVPAETQASKVVFKEAHFTIP